MKLKSLLEVGWIALLVAAFSVSGHTQAPAGSSTLLESEEQAIDVALEASQPGPAVQNVYLTTNASAATMSSNHFVRNPGLWIGPKVDLTAISAYSDPPPNYGTKFAVTAISPWHCLCAAHVMPRVGTHFNFVAADNTTVTRAVVATAHVADDVGLCLLNQPLPPSVTPMRILPKNWRDYLPVNTRLDLPVFFINQHNMLYVAEIGGITPGPNPLAVCHFPTGYARQQFNTQIISGDSSFPVMILVNGQPAIVAVWHYGGYGAGPVEAAYDDQINAAMRQLSKRFGYALSFQLRPADLRRYARGT